LSFFHFGGQMLRGWQLPPLLVAVVQAVFNIEQTPPPPGQVAQQAAVAASNSFKTAVIFAIAMGTTALAALAPHLRCCGRMPAAADTSW
jgi:hypothetical protein